MFETVRLTDWLTMIAILIGPIAAVTIQLVREERVQRRKDREWIFRTLMTNRGTPLNYDFVRALNSIDVSFYGAKPVIDRWAKLNAQFNTKWTTEDEARVWNEAVRDLTAEMLIEIGKTLGYRFEFTALKNSAYVPSGHGTIEGELHTIRKRLLELLEGQRKLPVATFETKFPDIKR